jgi:hypothetical protein
MRWATSSGLRMLGRCSAFLGYGVSATLQGLLIVPNQLTPEHIRNYQAYLFRERKLAVSTVTQRLAALRFFYTRHLARECVCREAASFKRLRA